LLREGQLSDKAAGAVHTHLNKPDQEERILEKLHYRVVAHDGGWAYKLGDVFSEPFRTHKQALAAAQRVAREQHVPGDTVYIEYEDEHGKWHTELALGIDRPDTDVIDG
jgi:hypothetical protein